MNPVVITIVLLAAALGCRMDKASISFNDGDALGDDLSDVWTRNFEMAILSDYIYQLRNPGKGIIPWSAQDQIDFEQSGYRLLYQEPKHGEYALFMHPDDGRIVVVFRGTNVSKPFDLLTNADFPLAQFDLLRPQSGKVANGYLKRWQHHKADILLMLQLFLDKFEHLNPHVIFTGHSLGGAVATIAGVEVFQNGINASVFTYSVPHFADEAFAQHTKLLIDKGLLIVSHEIDGDPVINTVRPALNPLASAGLEEGRLNYFIYDYDVQKPIEAHSIKHVRRRIKNSPPHHKEAFYKFYKSRPMRGRFGCIHPM